MKFQSSFELTGYITNGTFRLSNISLEEFQSSFELTGYITVNEPINIIIILNVSKLFRAYGLYNLCSLEGA